MLSVLPSPESRAFEALREGAIRWVVVECADGRLFLDPAEAELLGLTPVGEGLRPDPDAIKRYSVGARLKAAEEEALAAVARKAAEKEQFHTQFADFQAMIAKQMAEFKEAMTAKDAEEKAATAELARIRAEQAKIGLQ